MRRALCIVALAWLAGCAAPGAPDGAQDRVAPPPPGPFVSAVDCGFDTAAWIPGEPLWYCAKDSFTYDASITGYVIELRFQASQDDLARWILRVGTTHVDIMSSATTLVPPGSDRMQEVARAHGPSPLRLVLDGALLQPGDEYDVWAAPDPEGASVLAFQDQSARLARATFRGIPLDDAHAFGPA